MKALILGAHGLLGSALQSAFRGTDLICWGRNECDITDYSSIETIKSSGVHVVLNAAAWTNVDGAEEPANEPEVWAVNRQGPANVRAACDQMGAKLVHFSTNEVFAGIGNTNYAENDQTGPGNAYGRSKRAGEVAVLANQSTHAVVRVSWLYGNGINDFPGKILQLARKTSELRVVDDEFGSPTWTKDVANRVVPLTRMDCRGIWHLTGRGKASRYQWARYLLDQAGLSEVIVNPIPSKEWPRASTPPRHAVLKDTRLFCSGITPMPLWRESVKTWINTNLPGGLCG